MKQLFTLDNPVIEMLGTVWDMIILNLLFVICSIPVITAGASYCALQQVSFDMANGRGCTIIPAFFKAFKANFRQSTLVWLGFMIFFSAMASYYLIALTFLEEQLANAINIVLIVMICLVLGLWCYLIPLMARYENSLKEHIYNAGVLMIIKLPRTVMLFVLLILPILILVISIKLFVYTLVFWLMIGFAFTRYISNIILKPVFEELEAERAVS